MISKVDASELRQNLKAIEFLHSEVDSKFELSAAAEKQYVAYLRYYGLNFSELEPALAGMQTSIGSFTSGAYELVCQHFLPAVSPPRKTAFLLHGYFDHAGLYRHLIEHLLRQGIAVVVFDLPGHGLSSGATASIGSFKEYSEALLKCLGLAKEQKLAMPWIAIGQSTGGAFLLDALLEQKLQKDFPLQEFILLGPLLRPKRWSWSKILFSFSKLFLASTPRRFNRNSHDVEFLEFLKNKDALQSRALPRDWVQAMMDYIARFEAAPCNEQPLQLIQGKSDGTVEWETNIPKILEKFPNSTVNWIDKAEHHLVNESVEYRDQVFAVIDRILK